MSLYHILERKSKKHIKLLDYFHFIYYNE